MPKNGIWFGDKRLQRSDEFARKLIELFVGFFIEAIFSAG
jgi:hypothetical protein